MTTVALSTAAPATTKADALVVAVGSAPTRAGGATTRTATTSTATTSTAPPRLLAGTESVDAAFGGKLATVLAELGATGKAGELTRLASLGATAAPVIFVVGLGEDPTPEALRRAAAVATRAAKGLKTALLALPAADTATIAAVTEGVLLGGYDFTAFRTSSLAGRKAAVGKATLVVPDKKAAAAGVARGQALADAVTLCRDLVNTPPNDLPPAKLAEIATAAAKAVGLKVELFDEKALTKGGYGGILGVGQGSVRPPRLLRISYSPTGATRHVALVGKGITFDSGGLSLKPSPSMEYMKSDMAGSASVLATIIAAATLQLPVNVTAYMPMAENMPSGTAIRPGDVLTMYGGKRVEVLNTDAEGRLVLADAIVRAAEDSPDAILDIATLTGAQVVALGNKTAGVMANDDALRDTVIEAAKSAGELMWAMPLPRELRDNIESPVADLSNVAGNGGREAGMLVAGLFLQEFVPSGQPWAHLDIAGPSWHGGEAYGHVSKGGTGFGIRTMFAVLEAHAD